MIRINMPISIISITIRPITGVFFKLVIINKQTTPLDSVADLVIRDSASTVLGELAG